MKKHSILYGFIVSCLLILSSFSSQAAVPVWTFEPLTATSLVVPANEQATVKYQVTNQSSKAKTLQMLPIRGVSSNGPCFLPGKGSTCILTLNVDGSLLSAAGVHDGPALCQTNENGSPNLNQCYKPSPGNILNISKPPADYTVGGFAWGVNSEIVLVNNGSDSITVKSDGSFTFPTPLATGDSYHVTIAQSPVNQTCIVYKGTGVVTDANVTNIRVFCATTSFTVGGTVHWLLSGTKVGLQLNDAEILQTGNGGYTFNTRIPLGGSYEVTVAEKPANQFCIVLNNTGEKVKNNITNVDVYCAVNAYTVGGVQADGGGLTGLSTGETLILQNKGIGQLKLTDNGDFSFNIPVPDGVSYNVTVYQQPITQTCSVTNGSGTISGANVTNVAVHCVANQSNLSSSVNKMSVSVSGLTEFGIPSAGLSTGSGVHRTITITNTGPSPATSFSIMSEGLPSGTNLSYQNCTSPLAVNSACIITIIPGGNASIASNGVPCTNGYAPVPGTITVTADDASNPLTIDVSVLGYSCIYQEGFIFALDDSTDPALSVLGKVFQKEVANLSQLPDPYYWSITDDIINGIDEKSTPALPSPTIGTNVAGMNNCLGRTDGTCNSNNVVSYYDAKNVNHSAYAAGTCKDLAVGSYNDWYLPAICELGYSVSTDVSSAGCGSSTAPLAQNVRSNSFDVACPTSSSCSSGQSCDPAVTPLTCMWTDYASSRSIADSSTEDASSPKDSVWYQCLFSGCSTDYQATTGKKGGIPYFCIRQLTQPV